jgi:hypothetical protein
MFATVPHTNCWSINNDKIETLRTWRKGWHMAKQPPDRSQDIRYLSELCTQNRLNETITRGCCTQPERQEGVLSPSDRWLNEMCCPEAEAECMKLTSTWWTEAKASFSWILALREALQPDRSFKCPNTESNEVYGHCRKMRGLVDCP